MTDEPKREFHPARFTIRILAAAGVGLILASIWWQYSEQLMQRILNMFGGPL